VENPEDGVVVRASRDTLSERRELAAEGFIGNCYQWTCRGVRWLGHSVKTDRKFKKALLRMSLRDGTTPEQLTAAAALIQSLPGVLRVRVDLAARQFEIRFAFPTAGLLPEIHAALRAANGEIVASKVY